MFIHPKQEKALLTDADFISADKFEAGVAVNGSIGKIAGCWIKKSKKVKQEETTNCWLNPIIKLEPDSAETEYTEDELPALTIFLKKDTQVDHEWLTKKCSLLIPTWSQKLSILKIFRLESSIF